MSYIQYIIVRKDLVPIMGVGKTAAQVAHASLGAILKDGKLIESVGVQSWLAGIFTKVVVYTKSRQKLLNIISKCMEYNIEYKPIYDACLTKLQPEEKNGTTLTCVGLPPLKVGGVPKFLTKLRLLDG